MNCPDSIWKFCVLASVCVVYIGVYGNSYKRVVHTSRWHLNDHRDPYNPNAYTPFTGNIRATCPQSGCICVIDIPETDLYANDHPKYPRKPRVVNTNSSKELADDIAEALRNVSDPTTFSESGRTIYEGRCNE